MEKTSQNTEVTTEFRGRAGEWFGIWIVNLLLSIVTIGIYSAWAKVRRLKYFYNNTYIAGRNFDYHATGKQILIGRLIFIAGYIALMVLFQLTPVLGLIVFLGILGAIPWLLIRGMRFHARMTSFSNVRFDFQGTYGRAFLVFFLLPLGLYLAFGGLIAVAVLLAETTAPVAAVPFAILAVLFLPVAFAVADRAIKSFSVNNHLLGGAKFGITISLKPFLLAQAVALGWVIFVGILGALVMGFNLSGFVESMTALETGDVAPGDFGILALFYFLVFAAFIPAGFIYQAMVRNAVYNNATLEGGHGFRSDINPIDYFWIALSNVLVVICTLGLMLPWAQVRMMAYLAKHTHPILGESLDDFLDTQTKAGHAVGDAFADFEAMDVGLPV